MTECTQCRKRYEDGVRFCPVDGFAVVPVAEPWVGRRLLGQFQIESVCGHGATGTVYRAVQAGMDRQVAVKVLRADLVKDADIVKRFVREARAGAKLNHPNIATVHMVGQTEDGVPFLVMEYVEGAALATILEPGRPLPLGRIARIGSQIASALSEAHAQGIVHRDLKPENILLAQRRGESDVVKVVDFGIAKMLVHAAPGEDPISRMGTVFGTPHYIAPEQASGQPVDGRADLYSLGCILFQMATGRVPFDGQQGLQVLLSQVRDPVPDPRKLNPRIDGGLVDLLHKLLAKDPAARPPNADAVRQTLLGLVEERADRDDREERAEAESRARPGTGRGRSRHEEEDRGDDRDERLRSDEHEGAEGSARSEEHEQPPRSGRPRSGRPAPASGRAPSSGRAHHRSGPASGSGEDGWYAQGAGSPRRARREEDSLDAVPAAGGSFWLRNRTVLLGVGGALIGGLLVGVVYSQLAGRPVVTPPALSPAVAVTPVPAPPPQQRSSRPVTPLVSGRSAPPAAPAGVKKPETEPRLPDVVVQPPASPVTGVHPVLPAVPSSVPVAASPPAAAPSPPAAAPAPAPAVAPSPPPAAPTPPPAASPAAADANAEKPPEKAPEKAADKPAEKPPEKTTDKAADKAADKPADKPADEPEEPSRDPYDRLR